MAFLWKIRTRKGIKNERNDGTLTGNNNEQRFNLLVRRNTNETEHSHFILNSSSHAVVTTHIIPSPMLSSPHLPELQDASSCSTFATDDSTEHLLEHTASTDRIGVLVIGSTGLSGHEIIRQLSEHPLRPRIHAFVDESSASNLPSHLQEKCTSVVEGSIRHSVDLAEAIANTGVNWVLLSGEAYNDKSHHPRTVTAKNLATALNRPGFEHVRVLVVSRIDTAKSPIRVGGAFASMLRNRSELTDYNGQEEAIAAISDRVTLIRSTSLSDSSERGLTELASSTRITSSLRYTHRIDLASCVVNEIVSERSKSRTIHISSLKK